MVLRGVAVGLAFGVLTSVLPLELVMVGGDFEKGLAAMKTISEAEAAKKAAEAAAAKKAADDAAAAAGAADAGTP